MYKSSSIPCQGYHGDIDFGSAHDGMRREFSPDPRAAGMVKKGGILVTPYNAGIFPT